MRWWAEIAATFLPPRRVRWPVLRVLGGIYPVVTVLLWLLSLATAHASDQPRELQAVVIGRLASFVSGPERVADRYVITLLGPQAVLKPWGSSIVIATCTASR